MAASFDERLRQAYEAIQRLADQLSPELRAALLAAVARVGRQVDPSAVAKAIADGNLARAELLIHVDRLTNDLQSATAIMETALARGGVIAAAQLAPVVGAAIGFNISHVEAMRAADAQAARLVTNVSAEARAAIRTFVRRAFGEGLTRRQVSALIRPIIGLTERDTNAVINYRRQLVDAGLNDTNVTRQAERYAESLLRQRGETIGRTEILGAANRGQQALWHQAVAKGLLPPDVLQQWIVTPDDRLCPICASLDGQRRKLGEAFVAPGYGTRAFGPPLHPRCRCALALARVVASLTRVA